MKVNVLLEGPIGTGKTHSLRTVIDAGQELFVLATEPGTASILGDIPCGKGCHWAYVSPGSVSWDIMRSNAEKLSNYSVEQVIRMPGVNKQDYTQFLDLYDKLANFVCDRCGEEFGAVDHWDESRTLAVDGLTGLSTMAMQLLVGAKPVKSLPEWLGAQELIKSIIDKLCHDTKCNFVLLAHVEREKDDVSGRNVITVSTLGKALAPKIPKPFDEVIFTRRDIEGKGVKFFWSTTEPEVDQKARILPWSDSIEPTFENLFNRMKDMEKEGKGAA